MPLVLTLCYVLNSSAKGCPLLCSAGGDPRLQTFMLQRTPSQGDFTFKRLPCLELTSVAHAHLCSPHFLQIMPFRGSLPLSNDSCTLCSASVVIAPVLSLTLSPLPYKDPEDYDKPPARLNKTAHHGDFFMSLKSSL